MSIFFFFFCKMHIFLGGLSVRTVGVRCGKYCRDSSFLLHLLLLVCHSLEPPSGSSTFILYVSLTCFCLHYPFRRTVHKAHEERSKTFADFLFSWGVNI